MALVSPRATVKAKRDVRGRKELVCARVVGRLPLSAVLCCVDIPCILFPFSHSFTATLLYSFGKEMRAKTHTVAVRYRPKHALCELTGFL